MWGSYLISIFIHEQQAWQPNRPGSELRESRWWETSLSCAAAHLMQKVSLFLQVAWNRTVEKCDRVHIYAVEIPGRQCEWIQPDCMFHSVGQVSGWQSILLSMVILRRKSIWFVSLHECRAVLLPGYHMARTGSRENVQEMNSSPAVLI